MTEYLLPDTAFIINDQSIDGRYVINANITNIHPIIINNDEILHIAILHELLSAQDLSIQAWFSDLPLGQFLFTRDENLELFNFHRLPRIIELGGINTDASVKLEAGLYFMNVKNLQNRINGYKLNFW